MKGQSMDYCAAIIKIETELFGEFFICECADTVLASKDIRVNTINCILLEVTFEWGRQTTNNLLCPTTVVIGKTLKRRDGEHRKVLSKEGLLEPRAFEQKA